MPAIARPAVPTAGLAVYGRVTNGVTGAGIGNACVTLGIPGAVCHARTSTGSTADTGYFAIDLTALAVPAGQTWEIYVVRTACAIGASDRFVVSAVVEKNVVLMGCP